MPGADLGRSSSSSRARSRATLGHPSAVQSRSSSAGAVAATAPLSNLGFHCGGRQASAAGATGYAARTRPNQRTYHGQAASGPPDAWMGPPAASTHPLELSQYYMSGGRDRSDTRISRASMVAQHGGHMAHPNPNRDRTQSFAPGGARSLQDFEPPQQIVRPLPPDQVSYDPAGPGRRYRHHSQQSAASRSSTLSSTSSRELAAELMGRMTRPLGQLLRSVTHRLLRRSSAQQQQQNPPQGSGDDTVLWNQPNQ